MCGIVGYVGQRPACEVVMDALRRMEYRGYDSSGIALVDRHGKLTVRRRAGRLANLDEALAEMEPASRGDEASIVRLIAYGRDGFAAIAPAALPYWQPDFRDLDGFERDCRVSRRDGFTGRMAIHPDQVAAINRCYAPSDAEIERARKIVAAFEANPGAGTLGIDGQMVDIPHLKAARKILASL